MTKSVIDKMLSMREAYKNDIEILASISILLDEKEQARHFINKMDEKVKEVFRYYPIYYLLENK